MFDQALAINPGDLEALNGKGKALKELERYDESIEEYDKALSIDPTYKKAWNNKGNTLTPHGAV